ncbi:MAG: hypothetical protein ACR2N4_06250 [Jatrophihabitans sp.]
MNPESREVKIRSLAVLPVLALGCLSLAGCDSKAGAAAVVDGHRITESDLSGYLTADAKPIQGSDGTTSTPPKIFVLEYLVRNQVFALLLSAVGAPASDSQLQAQKTASLGGGTEKDLSDQITQLGLASKFEPVVVRNRELLTLINAKLKTNDQVNAALAKVKDKVTINPRYGSWDLQTVSLTDLGKKQLPSVLSYDGTLPGDVKPSTGQ